MTEEQTSALEDVATPVQESPVADIRTETDQQINWRRANAAMKEKEARIRELESRLDRYQAPQAREEPEPHLNDDDVVDVRSLKRLLHKTQQQAKEEALREFQAIERKKRVNEVVSRPDYQDVIEEYLPQLEKHYPHLAHSIQNDPTATAVAYGAIINSRFYHENEEKKRAPLRKTPVPKAVEPPSGMTRGASPLTAADRYQHMEIGEDLWKTYAREHGLSG
jgi:hypothetical protein